MPALYKGRPHLRAVPEEPDSAGDRLWARIEKQHLQARATRLRDETAAIAPIAALSNPKAASHFAKALTHLNEALEELK